MTEKKIRQNKKKTNLFIQQRLKAVLLMRKDRKNYHEMFKLAVRIQSAWRRFKTKQNFLNAKKCVIKLQACIRKFIHRRRFIKLKSAAVILQQRLRAAIACKKESQIYKSMKISYDSFSF